MDEEKSIVKRCYCYTLYRLHMAERPLDNSHCAKKPVTTMLTYPWKCTVLHCNHLGNTWKPLVLMTRHFAYCQSTNEGDNQSVRSSAPVISRCFPRWLQCKTVHFQGQVSMVVTVFFCAVSTIQYCGMHVDVSKSGSCL